MVISKILSKKKNILNIQYFDINNPKLKVLLIKENVQFNQHIVYLITDVCTDAIVIQFLIQFQKMDK